MILYRLLGNIRKSGYFGIAHSLFTTHFKNVPLRGGQLLLSYRQLVDKIICPGGRYRTGDVPQAVEHACLLVC